VPSTQKHFDGGGLTPHGSRTGNYLRQKMFSVGPRRCGTSAEVARQGIALQHRAFKKERDMSIGTIILIVLVLILLGGIGGIGGGPFYGTGYYGGGGLGVVVVILLILVLMGRI
jgi:hypothetical protein